MADWANEYQGRKRALVISISQYDKLAHLDFCEKDGNKMYNVLTQLGYDIPDKCKLIGGRVNYDQLRDSIMEFFYDSNIHPKDTVLLYFSGHGVLGDDGEHYLSSSEIDPDIPRKRGFSFDDLTKAREYCNSKTIFTILDCCYSGADRLGGKGDNDSARAAKDVLKGRSKTPGEGKCILAACKAMQKAYEFEKYGHSFFTFYLAEGLSNQECIDQDGDVTPDLLSRYIDDKIASLPGDIRPKQRPFLNCATAGKIVVAHHSKTNSTSSRPTINQPRSYEFAPSKGRKKLPIIDAYFRSCCGRNYCTCVNQQQTAPVCPTCSFSKSSTNCTHSDCIFIYKQVGF